MKKIILKISAFLLLFALMGASCKKDEEDLSYLDEKTPFVVSEPGFVIYKTKNDYFYNVPIRPYENTYQTPELTEKSSQITLYKGNYYFKERYRLIDNYIVSTWIGDDFYFTSLSFNEYIQEKLSPVYNEGAPNTKVINSIIDKDPFTEFYYSKESFNGKAEITVDDLNQLIKEKNLGKYFIKIK